MKGFLAVAAVAAGASAAHQRGSNIDKLRAEAKREGKENIQIHDYWASLEAEDEGHERKVRTDKNLNLLQTRTRTSPIDKVARQVKADWANNMHISDAFVATEEKDAEEERKIRANKNLRAFIQKSHSVKPHEAARIDAVAAAVARDSRQNIQVHDTFASTAAKSAAEKAKADSDARRTAFLQKRTAGAHYHFGDDSSSGFHFSFDDKKDSDDSTTNGMDKYLAEFAKDKHENKKLGDVNPSDFSQNVEHSYESGGNVISIPLSSQIQTEAN